jgi:hypothetical protein
MSAPSLCRLLCHLLIMSRFSLWWVLRRTFFQWEILWFIFLIFAICLVFFGIYVHTYTQHCSDTHTYIRVLYIRTHALVEIDHTHTVSFTTFTFTPFTSSHSPIFVNFMPNSDTYALRSTPAHYALTPHPNHSITDHCTAISAQDMPSRPSFSSFHRRSLFRPHAIPYSEWIRPRGRVVLLL